MSARVTPSQPILSDLLNIQDRIIAVKLMLDGAFESEMKRMNDLLDETTEKLGMVQTVEDCAAIRKATDEYQVSMKAKADELANAATRTAAEASAKLLTVNERERALGVREASVSQRSDALDAREAAIADAQNTKDAELRERDAGLTKRESEQQARAKKLAADIADFNRKLESLRA